MEVDLDKIISDVFPFDLTIKLGGKSYKVRPLVLADVMNLEAAAKSGNVDRVKGSLNNLLEGDKPEFSELSKHALFAAGVAIAEYFQMQASKNSQPLSAAIRAAVEEGTRMADAK